MKKGCPSKKGETLEELKQEEERKRMKIKTAEEGTFLAPFITQNRPVVSFTFLLCSSVLDSRRTTFLISLFFLPLQLLTVRTSKSLSSLHLLHSVDYSSRLPRALLSLCQPITRLEVSPLPFHSF